MIKKIRKIFKNERGFTLIELMIVVVILGILAGIAIPRYNVSISKAKETRTQADIKIIQNAVDLYYLDFNVYPTDTSQLVNGGYLHSEPLQVDEEKKYKINSDGVVSTE